MSCLPEPFDSIPRTRLLFGPSPIERLDRISSDLSAASSRPIRIYAKREDCNSGLAFGGNKVRKLEYLMPDALSQGATTLVSVGGIQSNHTRQVAAVAAKLGLGCSLLQEHWVPGDNAPNYDTVANLQLSRLMSAKVTVGPDPKAETTTTDNLFTHQDDKVRLANLCNEVRETGGKPYLIPAGASDHPLGGLGFARWAFEVAEQEELMGVFFDVIVVCAVTGSTMAGMVAGFKLLERQPGQEGKRRKIVGVDASARPEETHATVWRLARQTGEKIGLRTEDITADDVILDARYHAGSYGVPNEETIAAIQYGASMEGFITDPVYEGKSLAGMLDMARKGELEGSNVLYAHLGGQLALNSYVGKL